MAINSVFPRSSLKASKLIDIKVTFESTIDNHIDCVLWELVIYNRELYLSFGENGRINWRVKERIKLKVSIETANNKHPIEKCLNFLFSLSGNAVDVNFTLFLFKCRGNNKSLSHFYPFFVKTNWCQLVVFGFHQ